jgi:CRISPR/Cas system Type II protein with McrA/HNH and RuvC-like nuclease domain
VDHIIPRSIAPELNSVIANLVLMPMSVNQRKGNSVGDRQEVLAKAFHAAGLLSDAGFQRVLAAKQ